MIAHLWEEYVKRVMKEYNVDKMQVQRNKFDNIQELTDKTIEGKILDELGLERYCCRRMVLGHVDMIETI
jgi:DNA-directed RNA polymerase subunit N (RpoN/RPB10)